MNTLSGPACPVTGTYKNMNLLWLPTVFPSCQHGSQSPLPFGALSSLIFCHFSHKHYSQTTRADHHEPVTLDAFQSPQLCVRQSLCWNVLLCPLFMISPVQPSSKLSNSFRVGFSPGTSRLYYKAITVHYKYLSYSLDSSALEGRSYYYTIQFLMHNRLIRK